MSAYVRYVPLGIELDLTRDDLGHPEHPSLWEQLYRPSKWEAVLLCPQCEREDPGCPEWMYLRETDGTRMAVHKNSSIKNHPSRETDEHKAVNERAYRAAERAGLPARLEAASPARDRITDVLIEGEVLVGVETQLSRQTAETTRRRTALARRDGITSMWITRNPSAPLIDQAPWARYQQMPWHLIKELDEPMYFVGGIRSIVIDRCGSRGEACPHKKAGTPCTGWNAYFDAKRSEFNDHIVASASGLMVPLQRAEGRKTAFHWVSAEDARRYHELEYERKPLKPRTPTPDLRTPDADCHYRPSTHREGPGPIRDTGAPSVVAIKAPTTRPVINLADRPSGGRCQHWIGTERRYCNFHSAVAYLNGWRCDNHSPAAMRHLAAARQ